MNLYIVGQILGYITAVINIILYLPQVIHVYKVKDTTSLNSLFIIFQMLSCVGTLTYGIILAEIPIIISSISIFISTVLLGYAKWVLYVSPDNYERHEYAPINQVKSAMDIHLMPSVVNQSYRTEIPVDNHIPFDVKNYNSFGRTEE